MQVSIAPFDVRQGSFIGAAINSVTRSGTNQFSASLYHRMRSEDFVGTEARGRAVNPGTFTFRDTGVWGSGPIVRNKLFVFGNYENEEDSRPLHTFRANNGGEPIGGSITRVLASDLNTLSSFLSQNFQYDTGGYENLNDLTPAKRYLIGSDFNLHKRQQNQLPLQPARFFVGRTISRPRRRRASAARSGAVHGGLHFAGTNYTLLENIKSGVGEWNTVIGNSMSNNLIVGLTSNDESRGALDKLFPFVDILQGGTSYMSFGTEPFTVNNELRYKTFQLQDSFTKYGTKHTFTFGATAQRYESENVFWSCCPQSNYTYNSLEDFYTDANDFLRNPNRTTSPVNLRRFKVRYSNVPGLEKPVQPLEVWYSGAYAQDEWRPRRDVTVTAGIRMDVSMFKNTAYRNDEGRRADVPRRRWVAGAVSDGRRCPIRKCSGRRVPRSNWDIAGLGRTQVRVGTGLFTGPPLYVWISNQLGNTGVLIGEVLVDGLPTAPLTTFPFTTNPDRYKPTNVTGAGATSFELNVTDPDFKFPQVWRTNLAVDHRLPGGITGTVRVPLQQGRQRRVLHQRQSACRANHIQRRRCPPALDGQPYQQHGSRTSSRARSC